MLTMCGKCGRELTEVRPGKHQCDYCELLEDHKEAVDAVSRLMMEYEKLEDEIERLQKIVDGRELLRRQSDGHR